MVSGLKHLTEPGPDRQRSPLAGRAITILGAGIGGLTVALALARRGAQVTVLERADALREIGAGLQISPNAMRVLRALGVGDAIAETAPAAEAIELCDYFSGDQVLRLDLTGMAEKGGYHLTHRADLISILAKAAEAAGVRVRLGIDVTGVSSGASGARLEIGDAGHAAAPLIIAADGIRSISRSAIGPAPEPAFTGQIAWRALVPLDAPAAPKVQLFMGPGQHLVAYPLRDLRLMNVVAVQEHAGWRPEGWDYPEDAIALQKAFAEFGGPVPALLEKAEKVHVWGLFRHEVPDTWYRERLALLGDAVHPTLPFLAQGACMAIEDAWVLTECLAKHEAFAKALAEYQERRLARCRRIVAAANRNAWAYHLRMPGFRDAAHLALRLMERASPGRALRQFDWLYDYDATAAEGRTGA